MSSTDFAAPFLAPFAVELGIEALPPVGSLARARLVPRAEFESCTGTHTVHVSVLTALLDNTCGAAVRLSPAADGPFATLDLRMDHFAPATLAQPLWAEAECYRVTPVVAYTRAWVWQDDREKPVAACTATFMLGTRSGPATEPTAEGAA